jgi:hypothetical protein
MTSDTHELTTETPLVGGGIFATIKTEEVSDSDSLLLLRDRGSNPENCFFERGDTLQL